MAGLADDKHRPYIKRKEADPTWGRLSFIQVRPQPRYPVAATRTACRNSAR